MKSITQDEIWANHMKKHCTSGDPEIDHSNADKLLLELLEKTGWYRTVEFFKEESKNWRYA